MFSPNWMALACSLCKESADTTSASAGLPLNFNRGIGVMFIGLAVVILLIARAIFQTIRQVDQAQLTKPENVA